MGAALALTVSALPAAGANAAESTPGDGKTLTVAVSQPVDSLSPFLAQFKISTTVHRLAYDQLTNYDPKTNEAIPGLAKSWKHSKDGLTWTFTMRDGVKWNDGESLTAEDVAWTYSTMMEDDAAATANGNFVENFDKVTAPNPETVQIKLKKPQSTMLALDIPILPKHVWEKVDDYGEFNNDKEFPVVGSGPFTITGHKRNQSVTLEANKDYWRKPPKFDKLVFRYYSDKDAEVEALRKGEISFASELTPAQADALKNEDDIKVNSATGRRFQGYTINPGARTTGGEKFGDGNPALEDRKVRQAIARAIDKDEIVDKAQGGYGTRADGYIPARYDKYHWKPKKSELLTFDPKAAGRMLDEAGYTKGDDGIRAKGDTRLSLRLHVHNDKPDNIDAARVMEERLKDIGIEVKNQTVDPSAIDDALTKGEYDLIFTGWNVNPDPDYVLGLHTCDARPDKPKTSMRGDAYYCNKEYDKLYDKQLSEYQDEKKRAGYVKDMQKVMYDDAVVNMLTYPDEVEAYRTDQIGSMQMQPEPGGNFFGQDGNWSFVSATPAEGGSDAGLPAGAVAGIGAAVVVVAGGAFYLVRRRRAATAEDRE